jgi:hypothetical protein
MAGAFRSRVSFSYEGIGEMLRSPFMVEEMKRRVDLIKEAAEAAAPVGNPRRDPHSGRYARSFGTSATDKGGFKHDRAEGLVYNDAPEALIVEKGTSRQRGHHTLMNAVEATRD